MFPRLQLPQGQLTQSIPPFSTAASQPPLWSDKSTHPHPSPALMGLQKHRGTKDSHIHTHISSKSQSPTPADCPATEIKLTSHHTHTHSATVVVLPVINHLPCPSPIATPHTPCPNTLSPLHYPFIPSSPCLSRQLIASLSWDFHYSDLLLSGGHNHLSQYAYVCVSALHVL